jgi:hypothetical protein
VVSGGRENHQPVVNAVVRLSAREIPPTLFTFVEILTVYERVRSRASYGRNRTIPVWLSLRSKAPEIVGSKRIPDCIVEVSTAPVNEK